MLEGTPYCFHPFICSEDCAEYLSIDLSGGGEPEKLWLRVDVEFRSKDGTGLPIWSYGVESPDGEDW